LVEIQLPIAKKQRKAGMIHLLRPVPPSSLSACLATIALLVCCIVFCNPSSVSADERPNIVFVITDDQGYGDLGHTGNPIIKTPHIDRLAGESSQLTDYHVAPTCSPTGAALLTGHWTDRTGVWHTVNGRSMLRENEVTLGQMLKEAGYATGMFGKWHLGDNFPYRPEDRGFTEVYRHGGGGVGQTPDLWDNAYFDGSYFHNGKIVPAKGYCTDVFFAEAQVFIRESSAKKQPFLAYIALNAPHGPLHAPQKYLDLYSDQPPAIAAFFGMITNIDDNVGTTRALLRELGIEGDTLFIFTTDNGTATGAKIFNAGMRGAKGSEYEGGHRVRDPIKWKQTAVMSNKWRLVNGTELYDIKADPGQERNVIADHAAQADQMRAFYDAWWTELEPTFAQTTEIHLGHPDHSMVSLTGHDWIQEALPPWNQQHIREADGYARLTKKDQPRKKTVDAAESSTKSIHRGHWAVKALTAGNYQISLRRWPFEADKPITSALPPGEDVPGASQAFRARPGAAIPATSATLRVDGHELETKPVQSGDKEVTFTAELTAGSHQLAPIFMDEAGNEVGAYYAIIKRLP